MEARAHFDPRTARLELRGAQAQKLQAGLLRLARGYGEPVPVAPLPDGGVALDLSQAAQTRAFVLLALHAKRVVAYETPEGAVLKAVEWQEDAPREGLEG